MGDAHAVSRAYRLLHVRRLRRGHVTTSIACVPSKIQIKDNNSNTISILSVYMYGGGQTANVTIISYKPLSDLNFARCQVHALFS